MTIWSGIDTLNNPGPDNLKSTCAQFGPDSVQCKDMQAEGKANETRTNVLIGVTSVVAVTTGVIALFFTNWGGDTPQAEKKEARIMPVVGVTNGVTIGAVGRF